MSTHEFEVVGSTLLHHGVILALRRDEVRMPGGRIAAREVVEHGAAVAVLAIDDADRVVLLEQYRHAVGRRLWELPAGMLDVAGEAPVDAAARELAEEAGVHAADWSLLVDVSSSPGFTDESIRVYLATGLTDTDRGTGIDDEEAVMSVHRRPFADAVAAVLRGEIVDASTVAGLLALAAVRGSGTTTRPADMPWPDRPTAFPAR